MRKIYLTSIIIPPLLIACKYNISNCMTQERDLVSRLWLAVRLYQLTFNTFILTTSSPTCIAFRFWRFPRVTRCLRAQSISAFLQLYFRDVGAQLGVGVSTSIVVSGALPLLDDSYSVFAHLAERSSISRYIVYFDGLNGSPQFVGCRPVWGCVHFSNCVFPYFYTFFYHCKVLL